MAKCEERAGFLFSHQCHEPVSERCTTCSKGICQAHAHPEAGGLICSSCAKGTSRREQRANRRRSGGRHHHDDSYHHDSFHHHSPYLYGGAYYGYGHYGHGYWGSHHMHRNDFTEADGQNLSGGATEGFEDDVGGS